MEPSFQMVVMAVISAITSSGFMSLIIYLLQRRDRRLEKEAANDSAQSRMLMGLGHDKIICLTDRYVRRGGITLKEKRNLQYLWEPYAAIGGNGDGKIGYEACQTLPVISEEEAEEHDALIKRKEYGIE